MISITYVYIILFGIALSILFLQQLYKIYFYFCCRHGERRIREVKGVEGFCSKLSNNL